MKNHMLLLCYMVYNDQMCNSECTAVSRRCLAMGKIVANGSFVEKDSSAEMGSSVVLNNFEMDIPVASSFCC